MSNRRRHERGFALFLALLVLLVATISGITLLFNTQVEASLSNAQTKISKTFYAADSGINWAGEQLRTNAQFAGGTIPGDMSSNLPGQTTPDIVVTLSTPIIVGWTRHPGDQIGSSGSTYGTPDIVENFFHLESTATSTQISATKTLTCDVGIYPSQLQIAPH